MVGLGIEDAGVPGSSPGVAILGKPTERTELPRASGALFVSTWNNPPQPHGSRNTLGQPAAGATLSKPCQGELR